MESPFTMVVLIVLICVGAGVLNTYFKTMKDQSERTSNDEDIHRMQAEIDRLTERVRVLEKLATDADKTLRDEFRKLA